MPSLCTLKISWSHVPATGPRSDARVLASNSIGGKQIKMQCGGPGFSAQPRGRDRSHCHCHIATAIPTLSTTQPHVNMRHCSHHVTMHPVLRNRGPSGKCKFKGRVAPECAAGEISEMLVRFRSLAHTEVLIACKDLPPEDRDKVLSDFEKATSHLIYILELKLSHWLSNPYRLLGIGHPDVSVARTTCAAAFALAQSLTSDAARNEQHRLVKLMCYGPGRLYMEFRKFLEGAELADLPVLMHIRARAKLVSRLL